MNIHKFNTKPKTIRPKTIHWRPLREVKYPALKVNSMTWEIFSQEDIKLKPKEVKQFQLGLGFIMSEGVVLSASANSLKNKRCSLQNEVSLEDAEDIVITISNNCNEIVDINFYAAFVIKNYNFNNKMEMKNIYPKLPTAPPIEDQGQGYRLQKINKIQTFLEKEVETREALSKKYFRVAKIFDNVDTVLITITIGVGAGGISLLSTIVAALAVIAIEGVALFTGLLSIIGKYSVKKSMSKAEKHEKIKTIASAKLDTISSHISKALSDNKVTDEEFKLILEELETYKVMKEEVRAKAKKKIATETEETLIERGRQEARESFRKLVEKNNTRS